MIFIIYGFFNIKKIMSCFLMFASAGSILVYRVGQWRAPERALALSKLPLQRSANSPPPPLTYNTPLAALGLEEMAPADNPGDGCGEEGAPSRSTRGSGPAALLELGQAPAARRNPGAGAAGHGGGCGGEVGRAPGPALRRRGGQWLYQGLSERRPPRCTQLPSQSLESQRRVPSHEDTDSPRR